MYRLNEPAMEEIERDYKDPLISTAWKQRQMKFMIDEIRASWKERDDLRAENEELVSKCVRHLEAKLELKKENATLKARVSDLEKLTDVLKDANWKMVKELDKLEKDYNHLQQSNARQAYHDEM